MKCRFLADEVSAAVRAHARRMHGAGRNVAALARTIRFRDACLRQRHLSIEDNVSGFGRVRMIGIKYVRSILPHVRMQKSFTVQLALDRF